jgi:hypothetical protein
MNPEKKKHLQNLKDVAIIITCIVSSTIMLMLLLNTIIPSSQVLQDTREKTLIKAERTLDTLTVLSSNLVTLTEKDYIESHFVLPLDQIQLSMQEVAANLVIFTDVLTDSFVNLNQLITTYDVLGSNLYVATNPEFLNTIIYYPLNTTITQVSSLVEKLNDLADDLSVLTAPMRMTRGMSFLPGTEGFSMPVLSSLMNPADSALRLNLIDRIFDAGMYRKGFDVNLIPGNISLNDFNALKHVKIDVLTLRSADTNVPAIPPAGFSAELSEKGISSEEYIQWYYSVSALQYLARSGLVVVEELEKILLALPNVEITPATFTPELLEQFRSNSVLKNIPRFVSITSVRSSEESPEPETDSKILSPGKVIKDILEK